MTVVRSCRKTVAWEFALSICPALLGLTCGTYAFAQTAGSESLDEVNKELSNPISQFAVTPVIPKLVKGNLFGD